MIEQEQIDEFQRSYDEILASGLFRKAGKVDTLNSIGQLGVRARIVASEDIALDTISSMRWEDVCTHMINGYISIDKNRDGEVFELVRRDLNAMADALRDAFRERWRDALPKFSAHREIIDQTYLPDQYLSYCQESYVEQSGYRTLKLWSDMITVYRSGHIPCGWEGEFPDGKLLIF